MNLNINFRLFYSIRHFLPQPVRMGLRRWGFRNVRRRCGAEWPILESAARMPENWPGWPEGKRFAVVLTHDVEGPRGLARCSKLMHTEQRLGFRSVFNFIPEGPYAVPASLREHFVRNGFEIGIHDLKHDGKLYGSRETFKRNASVINQYLEKWKSVGFRAGFMRHNLAWLHDLAIKYDCSTFDTDPFEPQPDGANTIFPFWVPNINHTDFPSSSATLQPRFASGLNDRRPGYMELPYTLPQDSTLFVLLRERTIDIWKKKVDWIVSHSGMVLVNTHPDYMAFPGDKVGACEFPVSFYEDLLRYIKEKYSGEYYHAQPQEVAEYCQAFRPERVHVPRRVCMVSYSFFESDNRVMRYANALAARGDSVEVLALNNQGKSAASEVMNGVKVDRVQNRSRNERGRLRYLSRMLRFLVKTSFILGSRQIRRPYDLIHVHNIPDFLVFAAWIPKLAGVRLLLDIHDLLPEFYYSKFAPERIPFVIRTLRQFERWSAAFADHVIISNHLWHRTYTARSVIPEKCSVFINHVESNIFRSRSERATHSDPKIILYPGGLHWHQGLDIAIAAFARLVKRLPGIEFHIYGDGPVKNDLIALASDLGVSEVVRFFRTRTLGETAAIMAEASLGVVAKRADSFGDQAYSTKIMEFMSVGVPVIASRTTIDQFYFNNSVLRFFESGNVAALEEAMFEVLTNDERRRSLISCASAYVRTHSWEQRKRDYLNLVDQLV